MPDGDNAHGRGHQDAFREKCSVWGNSTVVWISGGSWVPSVSGHLCNRLNCAGARVKLRGLKETTCDCGRSVFLCKEQRTVQVTVSRNKTGCGFESLLSLFCGFCGETQGEQTWRFVLVGSSRKHKIHHPRD